MKKLLILLLLLVLTGCSEAIFEKGPNVKVLLDLHNSNRKVARVPPLMVNLNLQYKAQEQAEWMARHNRLQHSELNIKGFYILGENIARGQLNEKMVVEEWMDSGGHRANILNPKFREVGFGYARIKNGSRYWCTIFGSR